LRLTGISEVALALLCSSSANAQTVELGSRDDFLSAGTLVGRVCEDLDADGLCGASEPGIARARVMLSDGTFAFTDGSGRYHLAAVPSRRTELQNGSGRVRDGYGRLLVKLDLAGLGPGAETLGGAKRVVEWGPAALQTVDFAVTFKKPPPNALQPAGALALGRGEVRAGRFRYLVTGKSVAGHMVTVDGRKAPLDEQGIFAAEVELRAGEGSVFILDQAPEGELAIFRQRIDVVARASGGVLFIPRQVEQVASIALPDLREAPPRITPVVIRAPAGTEARVKEEHRVVSPSGRATAEIAVVPGENLVPISLRLPDGVILAHSVTVRARSLELISALLGVEVAYDLGRRELVGLGRGTATVLRSFGDIELAGGIDLDTADYLSVTGQLEDEHGKELPADGLFFLRPREPFTIERALDPEQFPPPTGDDGISGALNPTHARLWARLRHPRYGVAELGSFQADLSGVDFGRYERSLFGELVDARLPLGAATLRARGFATAAASSAGEAVQASPAHDEFSGTGGSLFYLRHGAVVPGSEKLRIEIRDGLTSLTIEERPLIRGQDYDIDYLSGRILLARPLPMTLAEGPLLATPLQAHTPVLIADYEERSLTSSRSQVLGGRIGATAAGLSVAGTAVHERRPDAAMNSYQLFGANGKARVGPLALVAETAWSQGALFDPTGTGGFSISDTGGLSFLTAQPLDKTGFAQALSLRASIMESSYAAQIWARKRDAGFSDSSHASEARAEQYGGSGRIKLGTVELKATADRRVGADPRDPLGSGTVEARDAVLRGSVPFSALTLSAEATVATLRMPAEVGGPQQEGERAGAGARAEYQLTRELSLNASHHQRVYHSGEGPAALDDTFSAVGATCRPKDDLGVNLRGGWGPGVGTQVQAGMERTSPTELVYGAWTADVDGPEAGRMVVVSGSRQRVDENADIYVEDLFTRDVDALRMARAVGIEVAPREKLRIGGRYERGVRLPFTGVPGLLRDTGSARMSYLISGMRISAQAEVRRERGDSLAETNVDRWQTVGTLGLDTRPLEELSLAGRLIASKTRNRAQNEAQTLEGFLGAALRIHPWVVLASYSLTHQFPLGESAPAAQEILHLLSLKPSVLLGDRLRIGAGANVGFVKGEHPSTVVAASIRPAVRLVGDLELAAEAARRSADPDGQGLNAYRVELAYWFEGTLGVALGYNLFGFSGNGVARDSGSGDRIYLRVEAAF
jgi:hypothetical protein